MALKPLTQGLLKEAKRDPAYGSAMQKHRDSQRRDAFAKFIRQGRKTLGSSLTRRMHTFRWYNVPQDYRQPHGKGNRLY